MGGVYKFWKKQEAAQLKKQEEKKEMEDNYAAEVQRQFNRTAFDEIYRLCYKTLVKNNGSVINPQKQIDCHQRMIQVFGQISPVVVRLEQEAAPAGGAAADDDEE